MSWKIFSRERRIEASPASVSGRRLSSTSWPPSVEAKTCAVRTISASTCGASATCGTSSAKVIPVMYAGEDFPEASSKRRMTKPGWPSGVKRMRSPSAVSDRPFSSARDFTREVAKVAPNWPTTFTTTSISVSAQNSSSSRARAAAVAGASRCETAFTAAAKSAMVWLKRSTTSSVAAPRRLASCRPTRSSRQLWRGELSMGCHCSSTMPSTWMGLSKVFSDAISGSSCSLMMGSSARITATVSMRLEMSAWGASSALTSSPTARMCGEVSSGAGTRGAGAGAAAASGIAPSVGSRRAAGVSSSASGARSPKSRSALPRARRSCQTLKASTPPTITAPAAASASWRSLMRPACGRAPWRPRCRPRRCATRRAPAWSRPRAGQRAPW